MNDGYGQVLTGEGTIIGEYCVLGCPKETRLRGQQTGAIPPVVIGARCMLSHHVVLYEGVRIGDEAVLEDRVRVGYDSVIGGRTRVTYGSYVCDRVQVGVDARIGGFLCDGAVVGDRSTVMGKLVHEYAQPHQPWWAVDEASPVVGEDTVVANGARVVGGVLVGPRSYVAAGAVVTKDVPPEYVVTGVNVLTPLGDWKGQRLQGWIRHWQAG